MIFPFMTAQFGGLDIEKPDSCGKTAWELLQSRPAKSKEFEEAFVILLDRCKTQGRVGADMKPVEMED